MERKEAHLQKDLAKDSISLFLEHSRKDDSDTVLRCLNKDLLLIAVANSHPIALTIRFLELLLHRKRAFERCCNCISFEKCQRLQECVTRFWTKMSIKVL